MRVFALNDDMYFIPDPLYPLYVFLETVLNGCILTVLNYVISQ